MKEKIHGKDVAFVYFSTDRDAVDADTKRPSNPETVCDIEDLL